MKTSFGSTEHLPYWSYEKNLEKKGVHDGMGDRSPNQLLAELTAN